MSQDRVSAPRSLWGPVSIAVVAGIFVVAALGGLVLLPSMQSAVRFADLWDAICSAAGIVTRPQAQTPVAPGFKTSDVIMTSTMLGQPGSESIGRGATLAQRCAICHGPVGLSRADSPNLAGQYAAAIYKELRDFKSGARVNVVMTPFAEPLSDQDMIDVANYYAYLPRMPSNPAARQSAPPRIVANGSPLRNIPACGACHGELDNKVGSPWLEGQPAAYLQSQLTAFAAGTRHNDISEQMRNVARQMTPEEIDAAVRFYASQPTTARTPE